jgi:hypothetical protein
MARFAALAAAAAAAAAGAADTASFAVGATRVSAATPSDLVGFSYEVPCATQMFSLAPGVPRSSFATLLGHLRVAAAGRGGNVDGVRGPNIRIGGNSADTSA